MPWETTLQKIQASLLGPVALGLIVIAIFCFGYGLMFSRNDNHKENAIRIGLGATVCGAAVTIASIFV